MSNILDYVEWRGDLPFKKAHINEVDMVAFSQIVMLDLTSCVPRGGAPLKDCAKKYFKRLPTGKKPGIIIPGRINELFSLMAKSERFCDMRLSKYVEDIDLSVEVQFSALTLDAEDVKTRFVVFSGTDDTLIGWKENFNLIYKTPTVAQTQAVKYLNAAAHNFEGRIIVLGHSKGGHLAMYSAVHCNAEADKKLCSAVSFDGPGLPDNAEDDVIRFKHAKKRIHSFMPQSSVIGRLFEHGEPIEVVKSDAKGLYQHDCFTWQVYRAAFVRGKDFDEVANGVDLSVREILNDMSPTDREAFVEGFFKMLFSTSCKTLTELAANGKSLVMAYFKADSASKKAMNKVLLKFISNKYFRQIILDTNKDRPRMTAVETQREKEIEQKKQEKTVVISPMIKPPKENKPKFKK